jgi:hypothetical protein
LIKFIMRVAQCLARRWWGWSMLSNVIYN